MENKTWTAQEIKETLESIKINIRLYAEGYEVEEGELINYVIDKCIKKFQD